MKEIKQFIDMIDSAFNYWNEKSIASDYNSKESAYKRWLLLWMRDQEEFQALKALVDKPEPQDGGLSCGSVKPEPKQCGCKKVPQGGIWPVDVGTMCCVECGESMPQAKKQTLLEYFYDGVELADPIEFNKIKKISDYLEQEGKC